MGLEKNLSHDTIPCGDGPPRASAPTLGKKRATARVAPTGMGKSLRDVEDAVPYGEAERSTRAADPRPCRKIVSLVL